MSKRQIRMIASDRKILEHASTFGGNDRDIRRHSLQIEYPPTGFRMFFKSTVTDHQLPVMPKHLVRPKATTIELSPGRKTLDETLERK